jgi:hypothetical protein
LGKKKSAEILSLRLSSLVSTRRARKRSIAERARRTMFLVFLPSREFSLFVPREKERNHAASQCAVYVDGSLLVQKKKELETKEERSARSRIVPKERKN